MEMARTILGGVAIEVIECARRRQDWGWLPWLRTRTIRQCPGKCDLAKTNRGKSYTQEQKCDLNQFVKFPPGETTKSDVFRGRHLNTVVIRLDDGHQIAPHRERYDVLFHVISGKGVFNTYEKQRGAESGSMSLCVLR